MMNKLLLVIILFHFSTVFGQLPPDTGFKLDRLPARATNQWRFHMGDNAAWVDTAFNDKGWQRLDPTQLRHFLPQVNNEQIGWFRLKIQVSPTLRGKTVALIVNQHGAAEIYFNGTLIRTMGRVSADYTVEQTRRSRDEPLTVRLSNAPLQYLAIRYSFNKSNFIIGYGDPVIAASFEEVDSAWERFFLVVDFYTTRSWVSGCFMLLGILQLAIYFFNRERKINLYLSVFAFLQLFTLMDGLLVPILPTANWITVIQWAFNLSAPAELVFLLAMTYLFFGFRYNWLLYAMAALCLPVIIVQFIGDNARDEVVLAIYNVINYLIIIGLSVKAVRQKKDGARLFLAGICVALIFFILFTTNGLGIHQSFLMESFEVALAFLTPAIMLAILLAGEFSRNLISLRQKLTEVERLSARSLKQEQEKQDLLARQNEILEQKVTERTVELNQSLTELKAAQSQLIQSAKMASLGELTAGIAHEIQNPLNFVNNFSDVNQEMLEELKAESTKPKDKRDEQLEAELINDLIGNEQKINHHGKRADAIVKSMLQHSRMASGQKEPTDLNALADEYLRLAYHSLREKDKNFDPVLVTDFAAELPKANVIPQNIGRVLLNVLNNAFFAIQQKAKTTGADYIPTIELRTTLQSGFVMISVKDNGDGIPDAIRDKVMQPFFTAKPTGEGTGLGLSLSYDIVVNGHGGNIEFTTKEGEGAEFVISLPV
ncbi:ATP-binding protein [Mucilaginibacter sp. L3T2-6]|uniref:ATP-binding protein n=1 Tax=Mucilaginibacter sp. L3T2-6 TaxID=3062491 RepID=UPI0026758F61|nr:ATP-binding protein [Mucilaginibacter sp. L3T2-6]MDO3643624.1 ATP-binding protein [Mucilaginibacter sp. L3T2-6]MDV6216128.1 ATP-binding protein [Mucilaginibacter sp. L3T2-6]